MARATDKAVKPADTDTKPVEPEAHAPADPTPDVEPEPEPDAPEDVEPEPEPDAPEDVEPEELGERTLARRSPWLAANVAAGVITEAEALARLDAAGL